MARATCHTLRQPPHGPCELAKEQQQVSVAGVLWRWIPLHTHYLLLPTPPLPPASVVPQHHIWHSRAGLQHSAALLSLALGCFPKPHILGCSSWLSLTCSHQLNAINITSASEIAFVSNKAAFWLPFLRPELQCKLQGASP